MPNLTVSDRTYHPGKQHGSGKKLTHKIKNFKNYIQKDSLCKLNGKHML